MSNKDKPFEIFTKEELTQYSDLVSSTINQLIVELKLTSKTKVNQAQIRLSFWGNK